VLVDSSGTSASDAAADSEAAPRGLATRRASKAAGVHRRMAPSPRKPRSGSIVQKLARLRRFIKWTLGGPARKRAREQADTKAKWKKELEKATENHEKRGRDLLRVHSITGKLDGEGVFTETQDVELSDLATRMNEDVVPIISFTSGPRDACARKASLSRVVYAGGCDETHETSRKRRVDKETNAEVRAGVKASVSGYMPVLGIIATRALASTSAAGDARRHGEEEGEDIETKKMMATATVVETLRYTLIVTVTGRPNTTFAADVYVSAAKQTVAAAGGAGGAAGGHPDGTSGADPIALSRQPTSDDDVEHVAPKGGGIDGYVDECSAGDFLDDSGTGATSTSDDSEDDHSQTDTQSDDSERPARKVERAVGSDDIASATDAAPAMTVNSDVKTVGRRRHRDSEAELEGGVAVPVGDGDVGYQPDTSADARTGVPGAGTASAEAGDGADGAGSRTCDTDGFGDGKGDGDDDGEGEGGGDEAASGAGSDAASTDGDSSEAAGMAPADPGGTNGGSVASSSSPGGSTGCADTASASSGDGGSSGGADAVCCDARGADSDIARATSWWPTVVTPIVVTVVVVVLLAVAATCDWR